MLFDLVLNFSHNSKHKFYKLEPVISKLKICLPSMLLIYYSPNFFIMFLLFSQLLSWSLPTLMADRYGK